MNLPNHVFIIEILQCECAGDWQCGAHLLRRYPQENAAELLLRDPPETDGNPAQPITCRYPRTHLRNRNRVGRRARPKPPSHVRRARILVHRFEGDRPPVSQSLPLFTI